MTVCHYSPTMQPVLKLLDRFKKLLCPLIIQTQRHGKKGSGLKKHTGVPFNMNSLLIVEFIHRIHQDYFLMRQSPCFFWSLIAHTTWDQSPHEHIGTFLYQNSCAPDHGAESDTGLFMSLSPHRVPDGSHTCQHRSQSIEFASIETLVITVYYGHCHYFVS